MSIMDLFRKKGAQREDCDEKVIDLSDRTQYPASVLADMNYTFALGDDSQNMISFLQGRWQQPTFHWGWDDITHEDAVKSDFLFRAMSLMNTQYRKRRDAMIASEGYRFVWKNKAVEPVPGILSGKELCDYMNRSLERDLVTIKNINASEDRDERRSRLNPTYEDLMAEMKKDEADRDFNFKDKGCGMISFWSKAWGNKHHIVVNTVLKKAYTIVNPDGDIVGFTKDDIDWDNVNQLEHNYDAMNLHASYAFGITDYKDGVAQVEWMLYPDGRYFADEDGFGMEDNDEVYICATIDTECRVVVKFRDIDN